VVESLIGQPIRGSIVPARKTGPVTRSGGLGKSLRSWDGKQLIRRLFQAPREMPNELSGQFVNVGAPKIVELFTPKSLSGIMLFFDRAFSA
jgi:hypothetical protein